MTLGSGSMLPLEGGIVRGVRRDSGGVPRSTAGGGASVFGCRSAERYANAWLPRARDVHAAGSSDRLWISGAHPCFPSELPALRSPASLAANGVLHQLSRWAIRCQRGRHDWGDSGGAPFVVSGQVWGEDNLVGRPAIFDMPVGKGHVVAFNFNPLHRDLNRGDQRLLWNAILNWQAIVSRKAKDASS